MSFKSFRSYAERYPGAPLVIAFDGLLLWGAVLLLQGSSDAANYVGVYAFISLTAGVVFQTVSVSLKGRKKKF